VLVIASAGNCHDQACDPSVPDSINKPEYPASYPGVLAVGSTGPNDERAYYSNTGSYVGIAAPGGDSGAVGSVFPNNMILSTVPLAYTLYQQQPGYAWMQGTSMAAPHVTGLAALLFSVNPALTAGQAAQMMKDTANHLGLTVPNSDFGSGRIDAAAAVAAANGGTAVPTSTPSATPTRGPQPTPNPSGNLDFLPSIAFALPTAIPTATATATPQPAGQLYLPAIAFALPTSIPTATATPQPAGQWTNITTVDFEGSTVPDWVTFDNDSVANGEYFWSIASCRAASGLRSGWPVGGGADGRKLACGASYPNNASSWLIYGPFDLSNATAAELSFDAWVHTEPNADYLLSMASIDGKTFNGYGRSGGSGSWSPMTTLDLANVPTLGSTLGKATVWVAIIFDSNASVSYPEGAYVDNVVLRKQVGGAAAASAPQAPDPADADFTTVAVSREFPGGVVNTIGNTVGNSVERSN